MIVLGNNKYQLALILIFISIISPIVSVELYLSSYSSSLLLSILIMPFYNKLEIIIPKFNKFFIIFLFIEIMKSIYFQSSIAYTISIVIGVFIIYIISNNIYYNSLNIKFEKNIKIILYFILTIILFNFLDINFGNYSNYPKSTFPFIEPSHFGLYLGYFFPIAFYFCKKDTVKILLLIFLMSFSVYCESFLLILITVLSFIISFRKKSNLIIYSFLIIVFIIIIYKYSLINLEYYQDRTKFENATNLSTLTLFQG